MMQSPERRRRPQPGTRLASLLALCAVFASCGLESMSTRPVTLSEMPCSEHDVGSGTFISHPWPISGIDEEMGDAGTSGVCRWLRYNGREQLTIENPLGRVPTRMAFYIAFSPSGIGATPASGDPVRIVSVADHAIVIENRTGQAFYLRFVLE